MSRPMMETMEARQLMSASPVLSLDHGLNDARQAHVRSDSAITVSLKHSDGAKSAHAHRPATDGPVISPIHYLKAAPT